MSSDPEKNGGLVIFSGSHVLTSNARKERWTRRTLLYLSLPESVFRNHLVISIQDVAGELPCRQVTRQVSCPRSRADRILTDLILWGAMSSISNTESSNDPCSMRNVAK